MQPANPAQAHTNFYRNTAFFTLGVTLASLVGAVAAGVFAGLALASVVTVPFIAVPVAVAVGAGLLLAAGVAFFATAYFAQRHAQVRDKVFLSSFRTQHPSSDCSGLSQV